MRKIHLHGVLGERFGKIIELEVSTAAEAVRALTINLDGFAKALGDGAWHVVRGDPQKGMSLALEDMTTFKLGAGDLHFIPAVIGSKNDGLLKAVLGIAIVGAAFAFSGGALAAPLMSTGLLSGVTWGNVAMLGIGIGLAGVSTMLAPEEKTKEDTDSSFLLSGPTNNYAQGSPVPLVYGEVITGSVVVSGGLDVERIKVGE